MEKCGLEVIDIMVNSIGSYYSHKNESTDLATGALINCGADKIEVSTFNKGIITNNMVMLFVNVIISVCSTRHRNFYNVSLIH